jgi:hypothetical protein
MSTKEIVVNVVVVGAILLMIVAVVVAKFRTTYFRLVQSRRLAEKYKWYRKATPRKLDKRELHLRWNREGVLPKQEMLRLEGTYRGHEFGFVIVEFPTKGFYKGRLTRHRDIDAILEVKAAKSKPESKSSTEFRDWLLKNNDRGPIETRGGRLTTSLGSHVWRTSFMRRLDFLADAAERRAAT